MSLDTKSKYNLIFIVFSMIFVCQHAKCDDLSDALKFINSRLGTVNFENTRWDIISVSIESTNWTWTESLVGTKLPPTIKLEQYSLRTQDLSIPTVIKERSVTFECKLTKCIHVKLTLSDQYSDQPKHFEEDRSTNTWWFKTEDDARRVANAMNFALERLGASKSRF